MLLENRGAQAHNSLGFTAGPEAAMQIVYRLLTLVFFAAVTLVTHAQGKAREDVSAEETLSAVVHVRAAGPVRPWMGVNTEEVRGRATSGFPPSRE